MTAAPAVEHGTFNAYNNGGCRCEPCRAAGADYRRKRREANPEQSREAVRRWRAENPEKARASAKRSRAAYRARIAAQRAAEDDARLAALHAAAAPLRDLLEARARSLSVTIARAPFTPTAGAARHRRSEIRDLLAYLDREVPR